MQRVERRGGALSVRIGLGTIAVAGLCPSNLALAVHRQLVRLMRSHPETFPALSMCTRTRRADNSLMLAYGDDRHVVPLETARRYLERLLTGHTGRHDEPE